MVQKDSQVDVELLDTAAGERHVFDRVLAVGGEQGLEWGTPILEGRQVQAEVIDHHRGRKVIAFKKKRRQGYKRKVGHRQHLTRVRIIDWN